MGRMANLEGVTSQTGSNTTYIMLESNSLRWRGLFITDLGHEMNRADTPQWRSLLHVKAIGTAGGAFEVTTCTGTAKRGSDRGVTVGTVAITQKDFRILTQA